ncbi:MAG: ATP-binding protein [Candidatus Aminicenantaceae bacterium]
MIKRKLLTDLNAHLSQKEITFIIGPRQAGKTTLMLLLKDYLDKKSAKTLFMNLDIESDKQFFASQSNLIQKIKLEIGSQRGYVFIDEIQRKEDAGIFLKGIYDMNLPYKFIVSGSGSVELKEKIHESLVGRKRIFVLSTLSFDEFVNFKTNNKYENKLSEFFSVDKEKTMEFLKEYLNFGGYPRMVMEELLEEKKKIMNEIYQSYLERDISHLLRIRKTEDFTNLVRVLASQIGNLYNASEISRTLGISQKTVKDYFWYLQKTFVIHKVTPYFKNIRKEITKSPVFYFYDLGLRNYAAGAFGNKVSAQEMGTVFENFVFNMMKEKFRNTSTEIHFWRTKDGAEVDFVIDSGREQFPVEVKYRDLIKLEMSRSFRSFVEKYQPKRAFMVNLGLEEESTIGRTEVRFIPFFKIHEEL